MNQFTRQQIDEYLDPLAGLHAEPLASQGDAEKLAADFFRTYANLARVGTVAELSEALWEHYRTEALAECPCTYCRQRRAR